MFLFIVEVNTKYLKPTSQKVIFFFNISVKKSKTKSLSGLLKYLVKFVCFGVCCEQRTKIGHT